MCALWLPENFTTCQILRCLPRTHTHVQTTFGVFLAFSQVGRNAFPSVQLSAGPCVRNSDRLSVTVSVCPSISVAFGGGPASWSVVYCRCPAPSIHLCYVTGYNALGGGDGKKLRLRTTDSRGPYPQNNLYNLLVRNWFGLIRAHFKFAKRTLTPANEYCVHAKNAEFNTFRL